MTSTKCLKNKMICKQKKESLVIFVAQAITRDLNVKTGKEIETKHICCDRN